MLVSKQVKYTFDDVLMTPQRSSVESRSSSVIDTSTTLGKEKLSIPILSSNMDTITGIKMALEMNKLGGLGIIHRADVNFEEAIGRYWDVWSEELPSDKKIALSAGSYKNDRERRRIETILKVVPQKNLILCAEIAHGHSTHMIDTLKFIRDLGFNGLLISGAVCTPEGVRELCDAGANAVRVGVGSGGACSTRIKTGCGYPQLSAIWECANYTSCDVIADGGIRHPKDAAKALAAGAKAIMLGSMLRGTDFTPFWKKEGESIPFRGMASNDAKEATGTTPGYEEGISTVVTSKAEGSTKSVIDSVMEGVRSSMSYQNSLSLEELRKNVRFIRVSTATVYENHPHSV